MGLMDVLQPFAKGYLGARVDQMDALAKEKAEQRKFNDQLKATEASNIRQYTAQAKIEEEENARIANDISVKTYNSALAEIGNEEFVEKLKTEGKLNTPQIYNAWKTGWINFSKNPTIFKNPDFQMDWLTNGGAIQNNKEANALDTLTSGDGPLKGQKATGESMIKTQDIPAGVSVQKTPEPEVKDGFNWASKYMPAPAPAKPTKPDYLTDLGTIVDNQPINRYVTTEELLAEPTRYVPVQKDETLNKDLSVTNWKNLNQIAIENIFPGKGSYQMAPSYEGGPAVLSFQFNGNDQEKMAVQGYTNAFTDSLTFVEAYKKANTSLPETLVESLNLFTTDANAVNPIRISFGVTNLFSSVKKDLANNFDIQINEMLQIEPFKNFGEITVLNREDFIKTYGKEYEDIYSQSKANGLIAQPEIVAQGLADISVGQINNLQELINLRTMIDEGKDTTRQNQIEQNKIILESYPEFSSNASIKEFTDEYLSKEILETGNFEELRLAVEDLAKNDFDADVIAEKVAEYIDTLDPDNFQKTPISNQKNLNINTPVNTDAIPIDNQTDEIIEEKKKEQPEFVGGEGVGNDPWLFSNGNFNPNFDVSTITDKNEERRYNIRLGQYRQDKIIQGGKDFIGNIFSLPENSPLKK
tara:strand:+ start:1288 stop:3213 length:1926 start_codon:yes stop_codon:yes gene_type:complete